MAIAFLNDINLSNNEIQNVIIQRLATDPTGVEGKIIYNNGSNTIKYYNGTSWIELDGLGGIAGSGTVGTIPIFTTNTTTLGNSDLVVTGTGSSSYLEIGYPLVTVKSLYVQADLKDTNDQTGTAGQLLSSLGSGNGIDWIDAPVSYTKWVLTGDSGTQDILDGDTVLITGGIGLMTQVTATDKLTITPAFNEYSTGTPTSTSAIIFGIDGDLENQEVRSAEAQEFTLDMFGAPAANIFFNSKKITSLADPTVAQDAATKAYVDSSVEGGLTVKGGFIASTGAITTGGNLTSGALRVAIAVGDYYVVTGAGNFFGNAATPLTVGDSVLVQTAAVAGASTEADFAIIQSDTDVATATTIGIGNVNLDTQSNSVGLSVGYSTGTALIGLDIKAGFPALPQAVGGADRMIIWDGTSGNQGNYYVEADDLKTFFQQGDSFAGTSSSGTTHVFTHNLGSSDVIVQLYELGEGINTGNTVYADVTRTNTNVVTVTTAASANIRCLIQKVG